MFCFNAACDATEYTDAETSIRCLGFTSKAVNNSGAKVRLVIPLFVSQHGCAPGEGGTKAEIRVLLRMMFVGLMHKSHQGIRSLPFFNFGHLVHKAWTWVGFMPLPVSGKAITINFPLNTQSTLQVFTTPPNLPICWINFSFQHGWRNLHFPSFYLLSINLRCCFFQALLEWLHISLSFIFVSWLPETSF